MTDNTTMPDARAQAAADKAYRKATRPWFKKKRFLIPMILVALMIISSIANGGNKDSAALEPAGAAATSAPTASAEPTVDPAVKAKAEADAKKAADAEAKAQAKADAEAAALLGTPGQANAKKSAESYLDFKGFSRSGLIKQLVYEKFSTADATWAVDHVDVDWNEQAAKSAQSYLDFKGFSHAGLVQQLVYEGFTPAQAEHGTKAAGL